MAFFTDQLKNIASYVNLVKESGSLGYLWSSDTLIWQLSLPWQHA